AMLVSNLSRDVADNIDVLGMPAQVAGEDQSDGAANIDAHGLVQASADFAKKLTNVFRIGFSHETFWKGRIAHFLEFFGTDCLNAIARGTLSQPVIESDIAPMGPKGANAIANEQPTAIIQLLASGFRAHCIRQVIGIYLRTLPHQRPKVNRLPNHAFRPNMTLYLFFPSYNTTLASSQQRTQRNWKLATRIHCFVVACGCSLDHSSHASHQASGRGPVDSGYQ